VHAFGRTLRQAGDLRLLALPVGAGRERYCVATGGLPLATFAAAAPAVAFFEALRAVGAEAARSPQAGPARVADLAASRRRRTRRDAARARDRPRIGRIGRLERGRGAGGGASAGAIVYGTPGIGPDGCVEEEVHPLDGRPVYTRRVPADGWDLAVARGAAGGRAGAGRDAGAGRVPGAGGTGPSPAPASVGRKR
jgi:hypothetical protein